MGRRLSPPLSCGSGKTGRFKHCYRCCGLYDWMFVPPTLWPFNIQDVLEDCLTALEKGKRLNARHRLIIDLLPEPPG